MTEADYELVRVASGAWSVRCRVTGETFHPVVGPVAEAEALYLRQLRIPERAGRAAGEFVIWDVGLGAAANVLTVLGALDDVRTPVRVVSFDHTLAPLRFAARHPAELGYVSGFESALGSLASGGRAEFRRGACPIRWEVHEEDFPALLAGPRAVALPAPDAILFDAFSPARNPAMWTLPLFESVFRRLDPGRPCSLATYSRSTLLRVTLLLAGFHVGAGEATGEKEETTVAANNPGLIPRLLGADWLNRARRSTSAEPLRGPEYRQAPLSAESLRRLEGHPQFRPGGPAAGQIS